MQAMLFLGLLITDFVVTVPAYFNDSQSPAGNEGGTILCQNVLHIIINELAVDTIAHGPCGGGGGLPPPTGHPVGGGEPHGRSDVRQALLYDMGVDRRNAPIFDEGDD
eukprot:6016604-Heterocapsa_arctica.AAC.1